MSFSLSLTYGKNSTFLLTHIRAGDQLKYVVVQLIIESGGFILAQLGLNRYSCQTITITVRYNNLHVLRNDFVNNNS